MKSSTSKALWYTALAAGTATAPSAYGGIRHSDVAPDLTGSTISWDLDNGGVSDFRLEVAINNNQEKSNLVPIGEGNGIALFNGNVDRLTNGETIGDLTTFSNPGETKTLFDEAAPANFDWSVNSRGFVGLRIFLSGNIHYAWADVSINRVGTDSFNHTLFSYAYQDVPQGSIAAGAVPEPSTAVLLIAGAAGVASMRRRRD